LASQQERSRMVILVRWQDSAIAKQGVHA
jgi:hypothetical protein